MTFSSRFCLIALCVSVSNFACGSDPGATGTDTDAGTTDSASEGDTNADDGCSGSAPFCAQTCGSDAFFGQATCVDDSWFCEEGVIESDCPGSTCWGAPLSGEVCDDGWVCRPWENGMLDSCPEGPEMMCADCIGFEEDYAGPGCSCTCDGGMVSCEAPPEVPCTVTSESTLPGVMLTFTNTDCTFTLDEAAAGLTFEYRVDVEDPPFTRLFVQSQDAGSCGTPDRSGLTLFTEVDGGDQHYCVCDTGLCGIMQPVPSSITSGTSFTYNFDWDGRNWNGPSDTGNPLGEPFPAGEYTVSVSAVGTYFGAADEVVPFEVRADLPITLVP